MHCYVHNPLLNLEIKIHNKIWKKFIANHASTIGKQSVF